MKIAVASGKGGTGKTTLAVSLARMVPNAVYVDLDVEAPNGHLFLRPDIVRQESFDVLVPEIDHDRCTLCGRCAEACSFNALTVIRSLHRVVFAADLCHSCGVCSYVCPVPGAVLDVRRPRGRVRYGVHGDGCRPTAHAGENFIDGTLNVGEASGASLVRRVASGLDPWLTYILDAPPGTNCTVVEALERADFVILVTEPTPFGVHDLELALELVRELKKPHGVVINKHAAGYGLADAAAEKLCVPVLGRLPFDRSIAAHYADGGLMIDVSHGVAGQLRLIAHEVERMTSHVLLGASHGA